MKRIIITLVALVATSVFAGETILDTPVPSGVTWAKIGNERMRMERVGEGQEPTFSMSVYGVTANSNRVDTIFRETATMPLVSVREVTFTLTELNQALAASGDDLEAAKRLIAKVKVTEALTEE